MNMDNLSEIVPFVPPTDIIPVSDSKKRKRGRPPKSEQQLVPKTKKPRGKGKQKIAIRFIENVIKRRNTFLKRLRGGEKKFAELGILTEAQILTMARNSEDGSIAILSNVDEKEEFVEDVMYQLRNMSKCITTHSPEDYGKGLENLRCIHGGLREKKKAGRPPKISVSEMIKTETELIASMTEEQKKVYYVLENLKRKHYNTCTMRRRGERYDVTDDEEQDKPKDPFKAPPPINTTTFNRTSTDKFVQETRTDRKYTPQGYFEIETQNTVEQISDTDFTVRSSVSMTLERSISIANEAAAAISDIVNPKPPIQPQEDNYVREYQLVHHQKYDPVEIQPLVDSDLEAWIDNVLMIEGPNANLSYGMAKLESFLNSSGVQQF